MEGTKKVEEIAVGYGKLIEVSIDFLIISATVFWVVKFMNSLREQRTTCLDFFEKQERHFLQKRKLLLIYYTRLVKSFWWSLVF
ncbi:MAG: large-conductance mechanosensitive channel [Paraglaciecola sp.]|jgi:large-conductance mechanosensitive channel